MYKNKPFAFLFLLIAVLFVAGCNSQSEDTAQESVPAVSASANPNADTGLASSKQDLKKRVNDAAQSNESPVGAAKQNMQ